MKAFDTTRLQSLIRTDVSHLEFDWVLVVGGIYFEDRQRTDVPQARSEAVVGWFQRLTVDAAR